MKRIKHLLMLTALAISFTATVYAKETTPGAAAQPASYFYTGKPYDADLNTYLFAHRNYDPTLTKWTSIDPSGFPDSANGYSYVTNSPTHAVDYLGLAKINISVAGLNLTFDTEGGALSQEVAGTRWKNETTSPLEVTWEISGKLSLNASAVVAGATTELDVSTSAKATLKVNESGWVLVKVSFDKDKFVLTNPKAAFSVSWVAKSDGAADE